VTAQTSKVTNNDNDGRCHDICQHQWD